MFQTGTAEANAFEGIIAVIIKLATANGGSFENQFTWPFKRSKLIVADNECVLCLERALSNRSKRQK